MNVTCNKCGWVYFEQTMEQVRKAVTDFNAYFDTLTPKQRKSMGWKKHTSIKGYLGCWCGNPYTNFRYSVAGDVPNGSTIGPILGFDQKVGDVG